MKQRNKKTDKTDKTDKTNKTNKINANKDYFKAAKAWADDIYTVTLASRNRYKIAFLSVTGLCFLLAFCVLVLAPMQHTELVVVHEGLTGYTWISTPAGRSKPRVTWAKTQSEIAHYVIARESYDPELYLHQAAEVQVLSSPKIQSEYELSQSSQNKMAAINVLSTKGFRTVIINSILPLDSINKNLNGKGKHINLVQVNFVVVDHLFGRNNTTKIPYTALVSWKYTGVPTNPTRMLRDWDGFLITKYLVQPAMSK